MSRFQSYINTAKILIETYKGDRPLATFLKQFFAANKKYGSKDRRQISALCYNNFRLGFAGAKIPLDQKMLLATFLCDMWPSELMEEFKPEWNEQISQPLQKKLSIARLTFPLTDIFPFSNELSDNIEILEFCTSFLVQPDLFMRIRPQTRLSVLKKLERLRSPWKLMDEHCVRLTNSDRVEDLFILDKEVVIQDYNSQKVLDYLKTGEWHSQSLQNPKAELSVWDCCAASGGKSILLNDILNRKTMLTVSDIRAKIILILHRRFKKAGIKQYQYFIDDITSVDFKPGDLDFDMIICDAPCTGSGTWGRTPEQLCFFNPAAINEYCLLQKKIITSVLPHLQKGGLFIYITCSIFKNENERMAEFAVENFNCELLEMKLLKGYDKKADNMFVAVFRKL
ncbi:MAG: Fmu (Sun) domain-containing protein [Ferruginibacter sp.]